MASGYDVAGPDAAAAWGGGTTMGGYEDRGVGAMATPEQLAAIAAAQQQQQAAAVQAANNKKAQDLQAAIQAQLAKWGPKEKVNWDRSQRESEIAKDLSDITSKLSEKEANDWWDSIKDEVEPTTKTAPAPAAAPIATQPTAAPTFDKATTVGSGRYSGKFSADPDPTPPAYDRDYVHPSERPGIFTNDAIEAAAKRTDDILDFIDGKTSIDGRNFEKSTLTPNEAYVAMLNQIGHKPVNQLGTGDIIKGDIGLSPGYTGNPDFGITSPPLEHPPEYLRDEHQTYHPAGPPQRATSVGEGIYSLLSGIPGIGMAGQWGGRIFGGEEFADRERNAIDAINDLFGTTPFNIDPLDPSLGTDKRSDLGSDIPAQMPGLFSGLTYGPPDPGEPSENPEAGNIEAIYRFLQDPNYGNMPAIDPISAMAAYDNAIRGIDAVVGERGFTDRGFAQAARDRSQGIFDKFEAGQDFDSMLNEKIGRAFADEALFNKDIELRGQGVQAINQAFPQGFETDIFNPDAFSKVAEDIYGQKLSGAQDVIARAGSRGQLSPRGGRLASESLLSQGSDVQSRLDDILGGVRSEAGSGLDAIRGSALEAAQGYKLGDELFDVTPFTDQARDYLTTTVGELPGRVSEAVGTDPLFSAVSALQEGGRQQGVVSGAPSFLDALAERESGVGTGRDKRGLGSRGSGVF